MTDDIAGSDLRRALFAIAGALVLGACASAPAPQSAEPEAAGSPPPFASASPQGGFASPQAGTPAPGSSAQGQVPLPEPGSPNARSQSSKLTLEAVDLLQNGEENLARTTLETALQLDPANELARKLHDQIRADAQSELGPVHFRYTVQRDDTLSKLAQLYMGDRYRFYILAKYNDISNPSRVAAGQVIRIPGRQPATLAVPSPAPAATPAAPEPPPIPKVAEPEPKPAAQEDIAGLLQKGGELERAGNFEGAYTLYGDAVQRNPGHADLGKRRDAVRARLVSTYDREATQAFQRQNLDLAIVKWDRILEIEPTNRKARLERERALDLKRRMAEKFGKK